MAAENAYKYDYGNTQPAGPGIQRQQERKKQHLERAKTNKNNKPDAVKDELANLKKLFKVVGYFVVVGSIFVGSVFCRYKLDVARRDYEQAKANYALCLAERKELDTKLAALNTIQNVDAYAVEILGFVKATPENEVYLDSEENGVIFFAGGESSAE